MGIDYVLQNRQSHIRNDKNTQKINLEMVFPSFFHIKAEKTC